LERVNDYTDAGGRATRGAVAEDSEIRQLHSPHLNLFPLEKEW
jgi:hypothetical protein